MDFTQKIYRELLETLNAVGYSFQTFEDFVLHPKDKVVVLRHDLDKLAQNGFVLAKIERSLDVPASYYY